MAGAKKTHENLMMIRPAKPTGRDLPTHRDVTGGKIALNENLTLARVK